MEEHDALYDDINNSTAQTERRQDIENDPMREIDQPLGQIPIWLRRCGTGNVYLFQSRGEETCSQVSAKVSWERRFGSQQGKRFRFGKGARKCPNTEC
jgi:hypothetical protein